MGRCRLRVYYGPQEDLQTIQEEPFEARPQTVTVALGDVLPLLADALRSKRSWVEDFHEDEVTITSDLYEILMAYQHFRRPTA